MKLDIFNIDDFIKANNCPEVTNGVFFNYDTTATADGLFSYELFGVTDDERKSIFGYVDLRGHYFHPLIWQLITSRMGSLKDIVNGNKYAIIVDRKIKIVDIDTPGAETGIDFIYNNFGKFDWINEIEELEEDSLDRKTRLKFLKTLKRDEMFVSKWLILPPYYRSESATNRSMGDAINKLYKELINKTKAMKAGFSYNLFGNETRLRIQNILKELYLTTMAPASGKHLIDGELKGSGKNSMIRKNILGKTVDWTASCVITSPENSAAVRFENKPVPYGYCAFPLATLLSLFQPFIVNLTHILLNGILNSFYNINYKDIKKMDVGQFNIDEIEHLIKKFIKGDKERFSNIEFSYIDKNDEKKVVNINVIEVSQNNSEIERPLTLADLMYIVAKEATERGNKHVYVTRYPVANFQNIFPARVKVLSTAKSSKKKITFDRIKYFEFDNYPSILGYCKNELDCKFYDVMICGNAYLDALGGDYDGDMLYMKSVFTQEANEEAERLIWAKTNMLKADGSVARGLEKISKECIIGLYELTKEV